ncbi:LSU ribosomal protein L23P [Mucilaginibacter mallensis]|jgi:large subunit ribosomal protein L23|uniref:Large ribosomal subunit protein uL23 n=1 Tax=Mucilaginibacter mallensis TaxID=652787 RepID=A0A1H2AV26_MUCMA|nr:MULTISPECIES: 50S ribosomal protein L23 [Mucilaginibacter]MBB6141359.1 large subunit ribosomal protein L23 [Mucilaginibacter sp. X5P1]SDT49672.1 LSU ribosomal protein L23P [Mucilaginibacter mallensis]
MEILKKPLLTEKVTQLTEKLNRYAFVVDPRANKIQIKAAIETMYGVTITDVNTMRYVGKLKSRNTKAGAVSGRAAAYKKAIITLKDGEVIDFYSNI